MCNVKWRTIGQQYFLDRFAQRHSAEQIVGRKRVSEYWYPVCQRTIYRWIHRGWKSSRDGFVSLLQR
jgi:IS30 family transposase